jgi:hypothetical protein
MVRRVIPPALIAFVAAGVFALSVSPSAQWLKYPTAGVPRTKDGKVNYTAPTPRSADGHPDFSGLWFNDDHAPCAADEFLQCGIELPMSRHGFNIGSAVEGGLPYKPETQAIVRKRTADQSKDDPHARCMPDTFLRNYGLPHMQKWIQVPGLLVMLNEDNAVYRQVFLDNRPLPPDPTPTWMGYSSAKWDGDTLVITATGFHDDTWLDMSGSFITDKATITERIRRPDWGHLIIEDTVDDPKAYTKPWTARLKMRFVVDTELVDEYCVENEKSFQRMHAEPAGKN